VFGRHLWYLGEILVALAFFNDELPVATKIKMVDALQEGDSNREEKDKVDLTTTVLDGKSVTDFVTGSLAVPPQDCAKNPA
jgi:hypothetical protein